jgi:uncharacterized DUF497 family protein
MLYFDWDPAKDEENRRKHRIGFSAASVALEDPNAIEELDSIVDGEVRLRTTGMAAGEVIVLVTHTNTFLNEEDELARIISARKASPGERKAYEDQRTQNSR